MKTVTRKILRIGSARRETRATTLPGRAEFEGSPFNFVF